MPSVSLRDDLDLDIEVEPSDTSGFEKYFKAPAHLLTHEQKLRDLIPLTLDNPAITSFQSKLSFAEPVPVGVGNVSLTIKAGLNGTLNIFAPDPKLEAGKTDSLFAADKYGENVPVAANERYVSLGFVATLGPSVSTQAARLTFGFDANTSFTIANYQKFETAPVAPTTLSAIRKTLATFQIPDSVEDLRAMEPDSVITLAGSGSLKFAGSANLLALSNPLATADLGPIAGTIRVSEGGSVKVGASFRIFGDYEIRVRKTEPNIIRLGYFRERGTELKASVNASAGLSLSFGDGDLFAQVVSAISPDAEADLNELKDLDPATLASITATVKAAIDRTLQVALSYEADVLSETQAAFLYEVDLSSLGPLGRTAIEQALAGDLSALTDNDGSLPEGITAVRSIFTNLRQTKHTFKVNLLGIYNSITISKLTLKGQAFHDAESGHLTLTDTAAASTIQATAVNVGGKPNQPDPKELRKVLAASLLITAAYRASGCVVTPPSLRSSHVYFELNEQTNREMLQDELDVAVGLGLLTRSEQSGLLKDLRQFGRTLVYATTDYGDDLTPALFLKDEIPRPVTEYEDTGRTAMQIAIRDDRTDRFRLQALQRDDLWKDMKEASQQTFHRLFPDATDSQLGVISTDYTAIVWWAKTMNETGQMLAKVRNFLAQNPNPSVSDERFTKLRQDFADHLKNVAANTKAEFGRPWGLIAMDMLTGNRSTARVTVTGPVVNLMRSRPVTIAVGANR